MTSDEDLLLNYSVDAIDLSANEGAKVANKIKITYSTSHYTSYEYDAINKVYKRSMVGKPYRWSNRCSINSQKYHCL
jgi:hypothetical protein